MTEITHDDLDAALDEVRESVDEFDPEFAAGVIYGAEHYHRLLAEHLDDS